MTDNQPNDIEANHSNHGIKPHPNANDPQTDANDPNTDANDPNTDASDEAQQNSLEGSLQSPSQRVESEDTGDPTAGSDRGTHNRRVIKIGSQRPGHEIKPTQAADAAAAAASAAAAAADEGSDVTAGIAAATETSSPPPATPPQESTAQQGAAPSASELVDDKATPSDMSRAGKVVSDNNISQAPANASSSPEAPFDDDETSSAASFPPPRSQRLSEDVQREVDEALAGVSIDDLLGGSGSASGDQSEITIDSRYLANVVKIDREYVFFSLPGHHEGAASTRQFAELPEIGAQLEVNVTGFKPDERMYELMIPGASVDVSDWSDIDEGVVVEVTVTGHNTGGLECQVGGIRGFIPISQIALYRVENCAEFVEQKLRCVVTEANPARGNLVLSHRALLEREREAAREELMNSLEVGQEHEGVVRKIMDFGAFVDIGGVDGLVHISKLSWDRVKHPSDVLTEGEKVKVKVDKVDQQTGKISLSYRDLLEKPWDEAAAKYPVNAILTGTVSKIMPFGAFVRIAPGIEGLVHISELAHHRVTRVDNVVREGQEVQVKILSIDEASEKMSLSLKAAQAAPAKDVSEKDEVEDDAPPPPPLPRSSKPLKGGLNKPTGGEGVGLNW